MLLNDSRSEDHKDASAAVELSLSGAHGWKNRF